MNGNMQKNKKGFTLAELLIVVAIIAVLVAISIPIFTSQLEKSRESVDIANIRAAYAEVMTSALTEDKRTANGVTYSSSDNSWSKEVTMKQSKDDWQTDISGIKHLIQETLERKRSISKKKENGH